jgi:VanZ family protein
VTLEEVSQLLVETRTFELIDLVADYLGIFVFGRLAS